MKFWPDEFNQSATAQKSSVVLSEGERWTLFPSSGKSSRSRRTRMAWTLVHRNASSCGVRAAGRLGLQRAKSASVIRGKSDRVLRLRSDSPAEASNTFRLAPLRMTEFQKRTSAEISNYLQAPGPSAPVAAGDMSRGRWLPLKFEATAPGWRRAFLRDS